MKSQIVISLLIICALDLIVVNMPADAGGQLKKSISFVLGLCACAVIALPVFNTIKNADFLKLIPKTVSKTHTENTEQYIISLTEQNLCEYIEEKLNSIAGINVTGVSIELDINKNNGKSEVYVKSAKVESDGNNVEIIKKTVKDTVGIIPEVVNK